MNGLLSLRARLGRLRQADPGGRPGMTLDQANGERGMTGRCPAVKREAEGENGFTLIEIVISLGILGVLVVAYITFLGGASKAFSIADERTTAESLARSQMEYIKSLPFDATAPYQYAVLGTLPAGWGITPDPVVGAPVGGQVGLQKVTFGVMHTANNNKLVITLEGYKLDR
jgi:prepilin-type N-terminal cleavage/methylation domain-containing protein